ncbi:MAG: MBL fold metallo-hydrolase [Pseudohongiellaceae bacterium]
MKKHTAKYFLPLLLCCLLPVQATLAQSSNNNQEPQRDDKEFQRVTPFQIFDNLYYVGAKWVAAWLLVSDQGLILFDTLYDDLTDLVIDGIVELGFNPDDVTYVVVTHAHYDHIGGARHWQEEYGAVLLMTEPDWAMTNQPPVFRPYPKPIRHLSITHGGTLNLGRTRLQLFHTPGHTPGVASTLFTVYDDGYPRTAFMFGGVGLNFSGVERTEMYIRSINFLQTIPDIEVNIPNHEGSGDVFARYERLKERNENDPHPFVDPEAWNAWLDQLLQAAETKLEQEQEAAGN